MRDGWGPELQSFVLELLKASRILQSSLKSGEIAFRGGRRTSSMLSLGSFFSQNLLDDGSNPFESIQEAIPSSDNYKNPTIPVASADSTEQLRQPQIYPVLTQRWKEYVPTPSPAG